MTTRQFQENTLLEIKKLASTHTETFLNKVNEAKQKQGLEEMDLTDGSTREALTDLTTAAITFGILEDKSFDEVVSHLTASLVEKSSKPLPPADATVIANALVSPPVNKLVQNVTNPDSNTFMEDKDMIRNAVISWSRSSRLLPIDQQEIPYGNAEDFPTTFGK